MAKHRKSETPAKMTPLGSPLPPAAPPTAKALEVPASAQIELVNRVVLPLIRRLGIDVTVKPTPKGMTLKLGFNGADVAMPDKPVMGEPWAAGDSANMLHALQAKIAEARAHGTA